jgi:DegV family protein with EDD domain
MSNVAIITDSVADIPAEVAKELGITVVPLIVRFGADTYRDGIDLSPDEFYEKLETSKILPVTSVASPMAFAEVYDQIAKNTDEIVVISLSSKLSGTYQVALQAIELMKKRCRVEVIDSQWAVMAQGFITIAAARAARTGASIDKVLEIAYQTIRQVDLIAAFNSLEYLQRGGRIGKAQEFLGSLLKINPIIGIREGDVYPCIMARSRKKAVDYLFNFAGRFRNVEAVAVEYATDLAEAGDLIRRFRIKYPQALTYLSRASPVIGTHTGPSLIVVSILGNNQTCR